MEEPKVEKKTKKIFNNNFEVAPDTNQGLSVMKLIFVAAVTIILAARIISQGKKGTKMISAGTFSFIFLFMAMFAFTSCDIDKAERALDKAVEEYSKDAPGSAEEETDADDEDEVKAEAEKPLEFFQEMLEQFCIRFYNDCYDKREYHASSLIAESKDVIDEKDEHGALTKRHYIITGKHSFDGIFKPFNDEYFSARVEAMGEDNYKVTFSVRKHNIMGDETNEEMTATRVMRYAPQSE